VVPLDAGLVGALGRSVTGVWCSSAILAVAISGESSVRVSTALCAKNRSPG
jgi:hypothetical protein